MALQGTLETFALADVLRLLASTKKTGTLRIDGDRGIGDMTVLDGELVGASASGAPRADRPAEVLFELLRFETGSFLFDSDGPVTEGEHRASVEEAIADAEEQLREWREIEAVVPSPTRLITLVPDRGGKDITLSAKQWTAIVALGTGCTALALGERLGLSELPATRLVRDLVELGAAQVGDEVVAGGTTPEVDLRPDDTSGLSTTPAPVEPTDEVPALGAQPAIAAAPIIEPEPAPVIEPAPPAEPSTIILDAHTDAPPPFDPQIVPEAAPPPPPPPPPPAAGGSMSFADTPSFLDEAAPQPAPPANNGPLFSASASASDTGNGAFAPRDAAFAPAPPPPVEASPAFAPAPDPIDSWNSDDDGDGLASFHGDDDDVVPLFGSSTEAPGPDDPFGPDPFTIPSFTSSPQDAKDAEDAAALARQLSNLSPRAQQAVAAAAAASTDEERDRAIAQAEQASDEPLNRNLLLKYLSSVDE